MKHSYKLLSTLSFLVLTWFSIAQDTTEVQAFSYSSLNRDTVIPFPAAGPSYERILMSYNMRCHGGTVSSSGNNNGPNQGGCGEWDYSCNTYITDSSRVDSVLSFTPDFSITGFSGTSFSYSGVPTYSFLRTTQKDVTINSSNLTTHPVVSGTANSNAVLPTDVQSGRAQFLYTASELTAAGMNTGDIHSMSLFSNGTNSSAGFLRIKIKATSAALLDENAVDITGFTEVYYSTTPFSPGANLLNLYQPFAWDGTSNLIVEMSYTNSTPDAPLSLIGEVNTTDVSAVSAGNTFAEFSGQRLDLETTAMGSISNEITIAVWVNGNADVLPSNTYLMEALDANDDRQVNMHLPWGNSRIYWDCGNDGTGYDRIDKLATASEFEGEWNHWVFTKNAVTGSMKIYLNGALWHSGTGKTKPIDIDQFTVGHAVNGTGIYNGKIDELTIWDVELDQTTIQDWMNKKVNATHPMYANLVAYYDFDEGVGTQVVDASPNAANGVFDMAPTWSFDRGNEIERLFADIEFRPNIEFSQGTISTTVSDVFVMDSTENVTHTVREFAVNSNSGTVLDDEIEEIDVNVYWPSGNFTIVDESGSVVGVRSYPSSGTITPGELNYYRRFPAKFELLSFVTPYGNGLNLGLAGKTYWFDVTDFGPILQGDKRITIERAGRWQEEMDIRFHFIQGTPAREVLDIQSIWRDASASYANISSGRAFEDRQITLNPNGSYFKIRSSITGHGQEGEFIPRDHSLNIDGGPVEFEWEVWKACGANPVFPQGGTWVYDRAGWCPGMATDVQNSDLTPMVTPGQTITVDYDMEFATGDSRYIVNHLLVTYGEANFQNDAAITDVMRPSMKTEYDRFNPACNLPIVVLQNTGETELTSCVITYQVEGGTAQTFNWTGNLSLMESEEVVLPVNDVAFWNTSATERVFIATVSQPNGVSDEYADNNVYRSAFEDFDRFTGDLTFRFKSNNNGFENTLRLYNHSGGLVYERVGLDNNVTYQDKLSLSPGCYTLEFTDSGNDGLSFWANPNQGTGYFQVREGNVTRESFVAEFGSIIHYDFYSAGSVGLEEGELARYFTVAPNPTHGLVKVEMNGQKDLEVRCEVINAMGQVLEVHNWSMTGQIQSESIDLSNHENGVYLLRMTINGQSTIERVVKF